MILFTLLICLFVLQVVVNVIGALGPELAFDALWYHLTLPKLYLLHGGIYHIPGGLLYYSDMPKFAELLYVPALAVFGEIGAKLIHFSFGLLTCLLIYKLSRKFFSPFISFLAVAIFYANLVVAWESITAYVDLVRAFFEISALWAFVQWWGNQKKKWLLLSALFVGFAITTKLLTIGSLVIFSIFVIYRFIVAKARPHPDTLLKGEGTDLKGLLISLVTYWCTALLIPLPWFIFSYKFTGNPVYPFFSNVYPVQPHSLNPLLFFRDVWLLLTQASDPISPIYLLCLPLVILLFKKFRPEIKLMAVYSFLAIIVWYITPRTGGGRFILPYLPAMSIVCAATYAIFQKQLKNIFISRLLLTAIIVVAVISIGYRFVANKKYIPVIVGQQTKQKFLTNNLNFSFGDFYDTDGYFKKHITSDDKVLLIGFHNLYYVDFPFIHETWLQPRDTFNYIATQQTDLPKKYKNWKLVYENKQTMVKLYKQ